MEVQGITVKAICKQCKQEFFYTRKTNKPGRIRDFCTPCQVDRVSLHIKRHYIKQSLGEVREQRPKPVPVVIGPKFEYNNMAWDNQSTIL